MVVLYKDSMPIVREQDVVVFRNRVQEQAVKIKMSLVNQTKLITAASEMARNMLKYAGEGKVLLEVVTLGIKTGIRLTFADKGPGIPDMELAMRDGYSTGRSMGLGLPGTKRLSDEFKIVSEVGKGTTVTIVKWRNAF